ncbi:MAG: hypothetical protein ACLFNB_03675 [Candidatus Woesearchaeota archaeon]
MVVKSTLFGVPESTLNGDFLGYLNKNFDIEELLFKNNFDFDDTDLSLKQIIEEDYKNRLNFFKGVRATLFDALDHAIKYSSAITKKEMIGSFMFNVNESLHSIFDHNALSAAYAETIIANENITKYIAEHYEQMSIKRFLDVGEKLIYPFAESDTIIFNHDQQAAKAHVKRVCIDYTTLKKDDPYAFRSFDEANSYANDKMLKKIDIDYALPDDSGEAYTVGELKRIMVNSGIVGADVEPLSSKKVRAFFSTPTAEVYSKRRINAIINQYNVDPAFRDQCNKYVFGFESVLE